MGADRECRLFAVGASNRPLAEFNENVACHLRPWRAPFSQSSQNDEHSAEESIERSGEVGQSTTTERKITQSGMLEGKSLSIFDDGSIEIEAETRRFNDFAELRAAADAKNGGALSLGRSRSA